MEFPEQKRGSEEGPEILKVDYRDLKEGGARQLVFKMRELRGGNGVQACLFEVTRYPLMPPTDPAIIRSLKRPHGDQTLSPQRQVYGIEHANDPNPCS